MSKPNLQKILEQEGHLRKDISVSLHGFRLQELKEKDLQRLLYYQPRLSDWYARVNPQQGTRY